MVQREGMKAHLCVRGKATLGGIRRTGHGEGDCSWEKEDKMDGDNHRNHKHQATGKPEDPAGPAKETLFIGSPGVKINMVAVGGFTMPGKRC